MRIGVIGGGAIGVAAASWMQRDGAEVFILEPNGIGNGASFGNAGCFNPSSVVPMSMPGMLHKVPGWLFDPLGPLSIRWPYLPTIAPWLLRFIKAGSRDRVEGQAQALRALLRDSPDAWAPLVRNAGAEHLVRRNGHLVVYRSKQAFEGDALGWKLRADTGIPFQVLGEDELRQQEPALSPDYRLGVFIPDNGHTTNPNALVNALADAFQRDGGTLIKGRARGLAFEGSVLSGIETDAGVVPADRVVIAAGAFSKPLAAELGDAIPLDTERGYHIMIRDPEVMPRTSMMDAEGKFVCTPMEGGLRLAGTVEFAGLEAAPDMRRAHNLLTLGRRLFPGLASSYPEERLSTWMGFRPSLPDSLPVIGHSRRSREVVYAFGHGHVGIAGAAQTGRIVADLLAGRSPSIDITAFSPARFGAASQLPSS
ncbi:NAD(P)/FAD-dependent oxidoreductase [Mangrovicella endophytica]|uniref:NAD(P)/FAD-dependent oxidoreductase n=1 Tax=Mangrovicella endophytica TaxID=2066697 RepID=UPI000C9E5DEF|nr:FAD-dependent oxidoreductase [Mangrovicella endophytica]